MACRCLPLCCRTRTRGLFVLIVLVCLIAPAAAAAGTVRGVPATTGQPAVRTLPELQITTCAAPCECLTPAEADAKWGSSSSRCSIDACQYAADASGARTAKYCFRQNPAVPAQQDAPVAANSLATTVQVPATAGTLAVGTMSAPPAPRVIVSPLQGGPVSDDRSQSAGCPADNGAGDAGGNLSVRAFHTLTGISAHGTAEAGDNGSAGNYSPDSEANLAALKVNTGRVEFKSPLPDWINAFFSILSGGR